MARFLLAFLAWLARVVLVDPVCGVRHCTCPHLLPACLPAFLPCLQEDAVSSLYGGYRAQRKAQREMPLFLLQQPTDPEECLRGIREMAQLLVQVCAAAAAYLALPCGSSRPCAAAPWHLPAPPMLGCPE